MLIRNEGIKLNEHFLDERAYEKYSFGMGIKGLYFTDEEKKQYILSPNTETGIFYINGEVASGRYLYARGMDETLYGYKINDNEDPNVHHSFFTEGNNVLSAGYFRFSEINNENSLDNTLPAGIMLSVSNESGHYTPTNEEMLDQVEYYYNVSKNSNLVYIDHTRAPSEKQIYHYKASEFVKQNGDVSLLNPIDKLPSEESHYGKKLNSFTRDFYKDFRENFLSKPSKTGYTPNDEFTLIKARPETSNHESPKLHRREISHSLGYTGQHEFHVEKPVTKIISIENANMIENIQTDKIDKPTSRYKSSSNFFRPHEMNVSEKLISSSGYEIRPDEELLLNMRNQ